MSIPAAAALRFLVSIGPANLPRLNEISLDADSLFFTSVPGSSHLVATEIGSRRILDAYSRSKFCTGFI